MKEVGIDYLICPDCDKIVETTWINDFEGNPERVLDRHYGLADLGCEYQVPALTPVSLHRGTGS